MCHTFGTHVVRCSDSVFSVYIYSFVCVDCVGDAEINQFKTAFDEDEIGGFEIRVDNVVFMDGLDAFEHFFPVVTGETDVEGWGIRFCESEFEQLNEVDFTCF